MIDEEQRIQKWHPIYMRSNRRYMVAQLHEKMVHYLINSSDTIRCI